MKSWNSLVYLEPSGNSDVMEGADASRGC